MDERAFGAITGEDVHAVIAAFERSRAAVEAKTTLGLYRAVAANARGIKDRFYVASEIDFIRCRRWKLSFINLGRAEKEGC